MPKAAEACPWMRICGVLQRRVQPNEKNAEYAFYHIRGRLFSA